MKEASHQARNTGHTAPAALIRQYRCSDLSEILGVSESTIWRWNRTGRLPKGRSLSPGVTVWPADVIDAWLNAPAAA